MKKKLTVSLLWLLPLIFLIAGLSFNRAKYSNDPEYIYLINALNLSKLKSVGHFDNPGITVMELGLAVVFITHLFDSTATQDLATEVLKNPDKYIEIFSSVLIVMICLVLFLIGYWVYKRTKNVWVALLIQFTPFFSTNVLEHAWTKTSPEPVLLMVSILLSGIFIVYFTDKDRDKRPYSLLFGIISGFALATKATYLPLAIIPFIILPETRRKVFYAFFTIITFAFFTIPAWPLFPSMINWFYNLLIHKGMYGHGEKGIIDLPVYVSSLKAIFSNNTVFAFIVAFSAFVLALIKLVPRFRVHAHTLQYKTLFALFLAHVVAILIVAKHYQHNHYLLPELAMGGVTLFFILATLKEIIQKDSFERYTAALLLILAATYIYTTNIPQLNASNHGYKITNIEYEETLESLEEKYSDHVQIYYFPTSLNKYSALMFGNAYSQQKNVAEMRSLYPHVLFFNKNSGSFSFWGSEMTFDEVIDKFGRKLLLVGGPLTENEANEIRNMGFPLKTIYQGRTQAVYVFSTPASDSSLLQTDSITIPKTISCDMETLSFDRQFVISENQAFFAGPTHSSEKTRSGKYAMKLDMQQIYALEHILADAKPGDQYRISIWRYADNNEGYLVVASTPSQVFYQQISDFVGHDSKGWRLITLYFTVPDDLGNNQLKTYVWNSGSTTMYFDDLLIERL
ncbi:MAG: hypothetical protein U1C46_01565 [Bacteroidales bacterium]|nr:hypothetical protein [Bacteroidales bacterium]MDZ4203481.1 hypothetical protein [Bacteroidales bacterium]